MLKPVGSHLCAILLMRVGLGGCILRGGVADPSRAREGVSFSGETLGVSFSGDIQDPPGQGPLQPTVGDPASAGGLD